MIANDRQTMMRFLPIVSAMVLFRNKFFTDLTSDETGRQTRLD
jgi:hypothetical protein